LQKTLDDCGIYVNGDDLAEIMMTLDHDGNGEVDFDEFLNLMTNTDIFLEAISEGANEEMKKRRESYNRRLTQNPTGKIKSYKNFGPLLDP
jgi:Ca2+-binding EF-hand superfamily protein